MATNLVNDGNTITITGTAAALASGQAVVIGKRLAVALANIPLGGSGAASVVGAWLLPKLGTDAVSQGDELYWDSANGRATLAANGNTLAGFAFASSGAGIPSVVIKINC